MTALDQIEKEDITTTIKAFIKRHSVVTYYALTFAISWGAILWVIVSVGIPATKEQLNNVLPVAIVAMLVGPSAAGILMTGLVDGRAGFRELRSRLLKCRVDARWYIVALLAFPLVLMAEFMTLSLLSPVYLPGIFAAGDRAARLMMGMMAGLVAGIFEELGWMGFAAPRLRRRYSILITGVIVGVLWGAWHIASHVVLASRAYSVPLSPAVYVVARGLGFLVGQLVALRVLMVWVYDRSGGSLLVAMLMHWSYTASTIILEPVAIAGVPVLICDVVGAAMLWVVAAVAVANRGQLSRRPLPRMAT